MKIKLMSISVVAATLVCAPAFAQITPGTLSPSVIEGYSRIFAGGYIGGFPNGVLDTANDQNVYSAPVVYSNTVAGGGGTTSGALSIITTPVPALNSSATLYGGTNVAGNAFADIRGFAKYSFQILGAAPTATVHVNAQGELGFGAVGGAGTSGGVSILFRVIQANGIHPVIDQFLSMGDSAGLLYDGDFPNVVSPTSTLSFNDNSDFVFLTNTVYDVIMRTTLTGTVNGPLTESMFANIDPMFTVDGLFDLQISPGFGGLSLSNANGGGGGVPEPATWAMLILGFAGVGAALRHRRVIAA